MFRPILSFVILLLLSACGGGGGSSGGSGSTPPPVVNPPPPPPPPTVTATITANVSSVAFGDNVLLTLSAANAAQCELTSTAPGSQPVYTQGGFAQAFPRRIYGTTTFTFTCIGTTAGTSATHSVTITTSTPAVSLKISQGGVNDIAWDAARGLLYLAMASGSPYGANSIVAFDPATGDITATVHAGSEPTSLSLNDDGSKLYVTYAMASLVSRFSLPSLTRDVDIPIPLYGDAPFLEQPNFGIEVAAAPGGSNRFAVSLLSPQMNFPDNSRRFIAFDDQTPLRLAAGAPFGDPIRQSGALFAWTSPDTLVTIRDFQLGATLERYDMSGGTVLKTGELPLGNRTPGRIEFAGGRIFTNCGHVVDAGTFQAQESFVRSCATVSPFNNASVLPDVANDRVYFIERVEESGQFVMRIDIYALGSRALLHTARVPMDLENQVFGSAWKVLRIGADGLAFRTTGGQLVILHGPLIAAGGGSLVGRLPPAPPNPPGWYARVPFSTLAQGAIDMVYEPHGDRLYVLLAQDAPAHAGEIAVFDPANLTQPTYIARPTPITALGVSDDGQFLYVAVSDAIERLRLPSLALDATLTGNGIGENGELRVAPGQPRTIAVDGQIFDDVTTRGQTGGRVIWSRDGDRVYTLDSNGSAFELLTFDTSGGGVQRRSTYSRIYSAIHPFPFRTGHSRLGDRLVSDTGLVFDPERGVITGTFEHGPASAFGLLPAPFSAGIATPAWGPSAIDEARHRAYFLACVGVTNDDMCTTHFLAYDTRTYAAVERWSIEIQGRARRLVRVGTRDLAAITYAGEAIYIPEPEAVMP
jgi:hypothetical protein